MGEANANRVSWMGKRWSGGSLTEETVWESAFKAEAPTVHQIFTPSEPTKFCPTSILAPEASPRSPVSKDATPSPQRSSKRLPQKRKSWNRSMNSSNPFFWVALFDCLGKYSEDVYLHTRHAGKLFFPACHTPQNLTPDSEIVPRSLDSPFRPKLRRSKGISRRQTKAATRRTNHLSYNGPSRRCQHPQRHSFGGWQPDSKPSQLGRFWGHRG